MNIYKYELRTYIKSTIIWCLSLMALLFVFMSVYPSFSADAAILDNIIQYYPEALLKAFGMNNALSLSTVFGYFAFCYIFIQLCMAIQSSYYGFQCLSIEESELTADFLMSKPVSRKKIIVSKFLAAFTSLTVTNAFVWIGSFLSLLAFSNGNEYEAKNLILLLAITPLFQLFFLSIGMLISVCLKKIRSVLSFSMGISFGFYVLHALEGIVGGNLLGIINPFNHFDPVFILSKAHYNIGMLLLSIAITLVSLTATYFLYIKRDIQAV